MVKDYRIDRAQELLDSETLRLQYVDRLWEAVDNLTPQRPFPELVYLHDQQRKATFASVLAVVDQHDLQEWFLQQKSEHMQKRHHLTAEESPRYRKHVLSNVERSLFGTKGQEATKAFARLDMMLTDTPEIAPKQIRFEEWEDLRESLKDAPARATDTPAGNLDPADTEKQKTDQDAESPHQKTGQSWSQFVHSRKGRELNMWLISKN